MTSTYIREGIIFGMGNPLLDICANVEEDYLKRYKLKRNDAVLATDEHKLMYKDLVQNFQIEYIAGGSALNTIKVAQWMLGVPHSTTFVGSVGDDRNGEILEEKAEEVGVRAAFHKRADEPTGLCAALLCDTDRSLCASLAAANKYELSHLEQRETWGLLQRASVVYISGFFLTSSPDSILTVAKYCVGNGKTFVMNLSAIFLCQSFSKPLMEVFPYVDILFGNESEAAAFAEMQKFDTKDLEEIARLIASLPKLANDKARVVVITHGSKPTIVANGCEDVTSYPVMAVDKSKIVDTNGAGDAFVGGFLSQLVQDRPLNKCLEGGNFAANVVIQRSGCTTPTKPCAFA